MRRCLTALGWLAALVLTFAVTSGCDLLTNKDSDTPTTPSPATGSLDPFVGSFSSASATTPPSPTSCNNLKYTVTPTSTTTATVTFSATCASNVVVNGTGAGTLAGTTLNWNAQGTVTQGSLTCPFTFPSGSNTAVPDGTSGLKINYSGSVCGIPVSGSEVARK
jgi:hypothetical protein